MTSLLCKQCTSLHGALNVVCTVHTFAHCTAVRLVVVCTVQEFSRCTEIDCALQCCSVHCSAVLHGRQRCGSLVAAWQCCVVQCVQECCVVHGGSVVAATNIGEFITMISLSHTIITLSSSSLFQYRALIAKIKG